MGCVVSDDINARRRRWAENVKMFPEAKKYAQSVGLILCESKRFGMYDLFRKEAWGMQVAPAWQRYAVHDSSAPSPVFDDREEWNLFDFVAAVLEVDQHGRTDGTAGAGNDQSHPENVQPPQQSPG